MTTLRRLLRRIGWPPLFVALSCNVYAPDMLESALPGCGWITQDVRTAAPKGACLRVRMRHGVEGAVTSGEVATCDARTHARELRCAVGAREDLTLYLPALIGGTVVAYNTEWADTCEELTCDE